MKKIIAYGAGAAFRNYVKNNKNEVLFAIDNNFNVESIEGIKIYKLDFLKQFLLQNKEEVFIIIFAMSSKATKEISKDLTSLGLEYGKDFNEYSILLKEPFQSRFKKHGVNLCENTYEFTKNLINALDIENQSSILGSWIFLSLLDNTKSLNGDIIELGVYRGGNAYNASLYKSTIDDNRIYYLVDSFEGFNQYSSFDPVALKDMFKDNSYQQVKELFENFSTAKVIKGFIPEVLDEFIETKLSIVYYDCDTYESCKQSLETLYPKLQKGGYFILHDYEAKPEGFTGVKKAVDEYLKGLEGSEIEVINVPETTHIILKKL